MSEEVDAVVLGVKGNSGVDSLIKLSTGVVLQGKCANANTLIDVMAAFPHPKPPMFHSPTMGRMMENPSDPDYLARVQSRQMEMIDATLTVFILWGTEFVSKPKGMPSYMDDEWLDKYALIGLDMRPENKNWRYLKWVKHIACGDPQDTKLIQEVVGRLSGVSKSDVRAAEEFPGSQKTPG